MSDLTSALEVVLQEGGYRTSLVSVEGSLAVLFEDDALLGFVTVFEDVQTLLGRWQALEMALLTRLRRVCKRPAIKPGMSTARFFRQRKRMRSNSANSTGSRKIRSARERSLPPASLGKRKSAAPSCRCCRFNTGRRSRARI